MPTRTHEAVTPDIDVRTGPTSDTGPDLAVASPSPLTGVLPAAAAGGVATATAPVPGLSVRRMTVGAADDVEERRADEVADRVVAALGGNAGSGTRDQQHADHHHADENGHDDGVRRSSSSASGVIGTAGGALGPADSERIASGAGGGAPLGGSVKQRLGAAMGADLGQVRIHTGPEARALNERMSAAAFTAGHDVYFRDGHPDLSTGSGQRLMAHELAHAVGSDGTAVHRFGNSKGKKDKKDTALPKPKKPGFFERLFGGKKPKKDAQEQTKKTGTQDSDSDTESQTETEVEQNAPVLPTGPTEQEKKLAQAQEEEKQKQLALAEQQRLAEIERKRLAQEELDKRTKDYASVSALTLDALEKYAEQETDWDKHSSMTASRPGRIKQLIAFAALPESGACKFSVGDLLSLGGSDNKMTETIRNLTAYGQAVQNDPFPIKQAASASEAVAVGTNLRTLLAGFPRWVLTAAMTEETFEGLRQAKAIDDVIAYYQGGGTMRPVFQAEDGADFDAYLGMRTRDKRDPRDFQGGELAAYVRNFHRFEARLLDRLIVNFKDTSKAKPLTLILHTALDHNGAFHRDPELFRVVGNNTNNTLMIEGGDSLDTYKSQITPLAQAYGVHDKIDQVMFAGHGNAQSMELAGSVQEGKKGTLEQTGEDLDVETGSGAKAKTEELFDEVLANMDGLPNLKDPKQPHRRLLFNACLTNSNIVGTKLVGDEANARKQIRKWIDQNMSLATFLNDKAKKQGKDVTALGANASINQVNLIDSSGGLDLVTSADPKVTASKLEYAEHGTEPTGVMRAAVESFGRDASATIKAMQRRMKAVSGSSSFDDFLVWAAFADVVDQRDRSQAWVIDNLRQMAEMAEDFSHLKSASAASLKHLRSRLKLGWGTRVLDTLIQYSAEAKQPQQGLMLATARLAIEPKRTDLQQAVLTQLDKPFWTVKSAQVDAAAGRYLDMTLLTQIGAVPDLLAGPTTRGRLVLALTGHLGKVPVPECKTFLQGLRKPAEPVVPGLPLVPEVPPVPPGTAPRPLVPEVPAVPGRPKVEKITGQRAEFPAVADLPKLDELPEVKVPVPLATSTAKTTVPPVTTLDKSTAKSTDPVPQKPKDKTGDVVAESTPDPTAKKTTEPTVPTQVKPEVKPGTKPEVPAPTPVVAPGRAGRPKRDAVAAVPTLDPYFDDALGIEALLGGASTMRVLHKSL